MVSISIKEQIQSSKAIKRDVLNFLHYLKNANILIIRPEHIYKLFKFKTGLTYKKKRFFEILSLFVEKGFFKPFMENKKTYYELNPTRLKIEPY